MTAWYSPSDAFDVRFPSRHGGCVFKLHVQLNVFPPEEITEMRDLCQLDKNYQPTKDIRMIQISKSGLQQLIGVHVQSRSK